MFNRLYSFLETNKCIYDLQFGFRQKHSTNHALLSMTQEIKETIDKGNVAVGVFVDFQKALDKVNKKSFSKNLNTMEFEDLQITGFHPTLQIDNSM